MYFVLTALFGVLATTLARSSGSIASDLQILLHNDLYGSESDRQDAVIVIGTAETHCHAEVACAALTETLWTPPTDIGPADFLRHLSHQTNYGERRSRVPHEQRFYIAGSGSRKTCRSLDPSSGKTHPVACDTKLPALCTQSASIAGVNNTDTSPAKRTQYGSFAERFTDSSPTLSVGKIDALDFDCLFLNIYTPFLPASHKSKAILKPVMFWIHGGAFVGGTGSDPTFDGGNLASRGDAVIVTINYRLGTFGFFVGPEGSGLRGNYALSDVVSALQWVKDNIAAFGGDPSRVTLFGQNAGAGFVRAMLMSPKASGLFSAAIMENIPTLPTYNTYVTLEQEVDAQTNTILNATNCTNGNMDSQVACVRALGTTDLATANGIANNVVIDGSYITQPYIYWNGTGSINAVPVMIGSMRDDDTSDLNWLETDNLTLSLENNSLPITPAINLSVMFPIPPNYNDLI